MQIEETTLDINNLVGKRYRAFDGKRQFELLFEHMYIVIIDTGVKSGCDINLVGIDADDLRVLWAIGGAIDSPHQYDGIVKVWVENGKLWAATWSGFDYQIDHRTGVILEQVYRK